MSQVKSSEGKTHTMALRQLLSVTIAQFYDKQVH